MPRLRNLRRTPRQGRVHQAPRTRKVQTLEEKTVKKNAARIRKVTHKMPAEDSP